MNRESAVQFATNSRIHVAFGVRDVERSIAFYRTLFGQEPSKTRPGYAKFEVADPPVNLALNAVGGETGPNNAVAHFGVQVKSSDAVRTIADRLEEARLPTRAEEHITCCYAVQDKVWATDPDGNRWEVYVVLDDYGKSYSPSASAECCPQVVPAIAEIQRGDFQTAAAEYDEATGRTECCPSDCCTSPVNTSEKAAATGCCTPAAV